MTHTNYNAPRFLTRLRSHQPRRAVVQAQAVALDHVLRYAPFGFAIIAAALALLLSTASAHAKTEEAPVRTVLATPAVVKGAIELRGACDDGVAVFTVRNNAKRWSGRGHLRITDGQTGHVLRERWLRFGEGQSASFRVNPQLSPSSRFKISVMLPDQSMTYKKSFRGRCTPATVEARNTER